VANTCDGLQQRQQGRNPSESQTNILTEMLGTKEHNISCHVFKAVKKKWRLFFMKVNWPNHHWTTTDFTCSALTEFFLAYQLQHAMCKKRDDII